MSKPNPRSSGKRSPDDLLSPREAAPLVRLAESTLAKMRQRGDGPAYIQISKRRVAYRLSAIDSWLKARERTRTVEHVAAA